MSAQKGNIFPLISAIAVLALLAAGYFFWSAFVKTSADKQNQQITTPAPVSTTQDETVYTEADRSANWKTYKSSDNTFNFIYPNDWIVQPVQIFGSRSVVEFRYQNNPLLTVSIIGNYNQTTGQPYQNLEEFIGAKSANSKIITLDGNDTRRITDQGQEGMVIPFEKIVTFSQDKKAIIELYFEANFYPQAKNNKIFDQILSTFKFL